MESKLPDSNKDLYLEETELMNGWFGKEYGAISINRCKVKANITLPKVEREDNVLPYSVKDFDRIVQTGNLLVEDILTVLAAHKIDCNILDMNIIKLECGITMTVETKTMQSHILNLIDRIFWSETNVLYHRASKKCRYCKETETVIIPFKYKNIDYKLKCYNKTLEQRRKGNLNVQDGLLRIEIIFFKKALNKLLDKEVRLSDIFDQQNLKKIIDEFKRLFQEVVIGGYLDPCSEDIIRLLLESIVEQGPINTIAKHRDIILDKELFREAIRRWNVLRGYPEQRAKRSADKKMCDIKKYDLPEDVIKTLLKFAEECR